MLGRAAVCEEKLLFRQARVGDETASRTKKLFEWDDEEETTRSLLEVHESRFSRSDAEKQIKDGLYAHLSPDDRLCKENKLRMEGDKKSVWELWESSQKGLAKPGDLERLLRGGLFDHVSDPRREKLIESVEKTCIWFSQYVATAAKQERIRDSLVDVGGDPTEELYKDYIAGRVSRSGVKKIVTPEIKTWSDIEARIGAFLSVLPGRLLDIFDLSIRLPFLPEVGEVGTIELVFLLLFGGLAIRFDYTCWPGVVAAGVVGILIGNRVIRGGFLKRPGNWAKLVSLLLYAAAFYLVLTQVFGLARSPKWINLMFSSIEEVNHSMRGVTPTPTRWIKLPPPVGTPTP